MADRRIHARSRSVMAIAAGGAVLLAVSGCNVKEPKTDLANGKALFVGKGQCGSCHTLARAGTKGVVGPSLDEAFKQALADGLKRDTIRGVVANQIAYPGRGGVMPANLVKGKAAQDVAAYVSSVVARPGKDAGLLASIGQAQQKATVAAQGGVLEIDADPTGQLLYAAKAATATAGKLTLRSKNASTVSHNISLEGQGVKQEGQIVKSGGVSEVTVDVKPGAYTFYCSVPGHRQGGMQGKLTVS